MSDTLDLNKGSLRNVSLRNSAYFNFATIAQQRTKESCSLGAAVISFCGEERPQQAVTGSATVVEAAMADASN